VLAVEITPRAAAQVERAAHWWAENRPAAPEAIRIDFDEAQVLLARQAGLVRVPLRRGTLTFAESISRESGITFTTA
jgi:hypothetical protein